MLSFFAKKKTSPDTPPEEVIPGPEPAQNGDDFIFIERRPGQPQPPPTTGPMYPSMPPAPFGMPYPASPYQPGAQGTTTSQITPIPYIQGVPFELAPQLSTTNSLDLIQLQVDGILAVMTRQMSVDEQDTYNFSLERSVQSGSEVY